MSKRATADMPPHEIAMPPLPIEIEAPEPEVQASPEEQEVVETPPNPPVNNELEEVKERNFKSMRERVEKAERERDELKWRLGEIESRQNQARDIPTQPEENDFNLKDDDLPEGRHLKQVFREVKQLKKELDTYKNQTSAMTVEQRIRQEMPDFSAVVSDENVALLKTMEPELADSLAANPDYYSKAKAAYKMIERLGIYSRNKFDAEKAIAQKNAAKPRPLASVSPQQGDSPLSKANAFANGLTDELRKQLMKEMTEARRGY